MGRIKCLLILLVAAFTLFKPSHSLVSSNDGSSTSNSSDVGNNTCVMYGKCGSGPIPIGDAGIPCAIDTSPSLVNISLLTATETKSFQELCGYDLKSTPLCCDHTQIKDLVFSATTLKGFFFKCPACLHNLYTYFCSMACHPNQGSFLKVTQSKINETTHQRQVVQILMSVDSTFRDDLFSSCSEVTNDNAPDGKAISLICQEDCDGKKLLAKFGEVGYSPFECIQQYDDDAKTLVTSSFLNETLYECQEVLSKEVWPLNPSSCSCSNCHAACFTPIFPPWDDHATQLQIVDFTLLGVFLLSTAITVAIGVVACRRADDQTDQVEDDHYNLPVNKGWYRLLLPLVHSWVKFVTRHPSAVIIVSVLLLALSCAVAFKTLKMQSDPVELWSAPHARGRLEKNFFDENFGPFYRIEQAIITVDENGNFTSGNLTYSPIFDQKFLLKMLELQQKLVSVTGNKTNTTLDQLCFAPLDKCMVQSPLNYFQSNASLIDGTYNQSQVLKHMNHCLKNPVLTADGDFFNTTCLSSWGGPGLREVVFGGYDDEGNYTEDWHRYPTARSFIITMLVKDSLNETYRRTAEDFEQSWLDVLHDASAQENWFTTSEGVNVTYRITYFSGRSIVDEIARQSESDISTIAVSYLLMFLYISLTLGSLVSMKRLFIDSKVTLGLGGVIIVLACVAMSIGLLSPFIEFNLIIIEVIPFLVLAIGVDNMFLMVIEMRSRMKLHIQMGLEKEEAYEEEQIAETLADVIAFCVGQSIFISVASESACFVFGYFVSSMPAVRVFALTAGVALIILLILQFSTFLAFLYWDSCRTFRGSPDPLVAPLHLLVKCVTREPSGEDSSVSPLQPTDVASNENTEESDGIYVFICARILYGVFIKRKFFRTLIVMTWLFTLFFSIHLIPRMDVGLDQEDSVPRDSYVLKYMKDQKELLRVGAPLYFVVDSSNLQFNYSQVSYRQAICSDSGGGSKSLDNIVQVWSQEGPYRDNINTKFIRSHATSWINEFANVWFRNDDCCRVFKDPDTQELKFCDIGDTGHDCDSCSGAIDDEHLQGNTFKMLLKGFLHQRPGPPPLCPSGGSAQYPSSINFTDNYDIRAAYYSTYHLPAKSSQDMINSIITARRVSDEIEESLRSTQADVRVFPYSIFYVFYEQYLNTWLDTAIGVSTSTLAVLVVVFTSRALVSWINHIIFTVTLVSFTIHVLGLISLMNVSLNALTVVNLIMSIGIAVEFLSHIAIQYATYQTVPCPSGDKKRMERTMEKTVAPVLAGITLTKLVGIIVLAFATSQIFTTYYFRFYTALIIVGAYHGLIILPTLLLSLSRSAKRIPASPSTSAE